MKTDQALEFRLSLKIFSLLFEQLSNADDRNLLEKHTLQYTRRIAGFQFTKIYHKYDNVNIRGLRDFCVIESNVTVKYIRDLFT